MFSVVVVNMSDVCIGVCCVCVIIICGFGITNCVCYCCVVCGWVLLLVLMCVL